MRKIVYCSKIGQKSCTFCVFWKIQSLVFPGNTLKWKNHIVIHFYCKSFTWKTLVLGLCAKMLTASSQIAGFFKVYFLKKEVRDKADFLHVDIVSKFPTSWYYYLWHALPAMLKVPEITSLQYLCRNSRKRPEINLIFCMKINIKVFYKLLLSSLVVIARHYAQSIRNNKFALPSQYFKKEVRYKADFFHADKYQNFLQAWFCQFWWAWPLMSKVPKTSGLQTLCNILGNKWGKKLILCADKHQSFLQLILSYLMGMIMHA